MESLFKKMKAHWAGSASFAVAVIAIAVASVVACTKEGVGNSKTALIIVDVQQFYFPGGALPLVNPESASRNCKRLLEKFRSENGLIVHIGHNTSHEKAFHPDVAPLKGEKVIYKDDVSAFNGTELLKYLRDHGVERLVVCGMQTQMCVEGTVRAAHDLGFDCVLVEDACATRDLTYGDRTVSAADVHSSTLSALNQAYATVVDTDTFLAKY